MPKTGIFTVMLLVLVLAVPCLSSPQRTLSAQQSRPAEVSATPAATADGYRAERREREGKLLVKEEEGEVDPNVAFRHSWAVRMISKITGLSIDGAFWLCMALNFIIIIGVLWLLLRKIVPAVFRNRADAIQRRLEEARKTSDDARRRLAEVEARLSRLDAEIEHMRAEAQDASRREEERVLAAVEDERRRIVASAEQEIARAAGAARRELKAYTAELGVSLAEKRILIEESTDRKLVRDFASQMGRDGN